MAELKDAKRRLKTITRSCPMRLSGMDAILRCGARGW